MHSSGGGGGQYETSEGGHYETTTHQYEEGSDQSPGESPVKSKPHTHTLCHKHLINTI